MTTDSISYLLLLKDQGCAVFNCMFTPPSLCLYLLLLEDKFIYKTCLKHHLLYEAFLESDSLHPPPQGELTTSSSVLLCTLCTLNNERRSGF